MTRPILVADDTRDCADAQEPTLRTVSQLLAAGLVSADRAADLHAVGDRYAVAITPEVARIIDRDDPSDPIARQFVPSEAELETMSDELADPIGDGRHSPVKGIVHRYPDRVLLKALHACPVYCRFCFRREQVGPGGDMLSETEIDAAIAYIRS